MPRSLFVPVVACLLVLLVGSLIALIRELRR
jgi:hypothetical protein